MLPDPTADQANLAALRQLTRQHPHLKVLLSIGGAAQSKNFPIAAASAPARRHFAQTAVQLASRAGLDGIDVDWEFPRDSREKENFVALLAELRDRLRARVPSLLTIAAGPTAGSFDGIDWPRAQASLDWLNLMCYDYHGAWSTVTNFVSPLHAASDDPAPPAQRATYNAAATVGAYRAAGVPAAKLALGVSLYGVGWRGVPDVRRRIGGLCALVQAGGPVVASFGSVRREAGYAGEDSTESAHSRYLSLPSPQFRYYRGWSAAME